MHISYKACTLLLRVSTANYMVNLLSGDVATLFLGHYFSF